MRRTDAVKMNKIIAAIRRSNLPSGVKAKLIKEAKKNKEIEK